MTRKKAEAASVASQAKTAPTRRAKPAERHRKLAPAMPDADPAPMYESVLDETNRDDIARLAYALWQERGCPVGSPEEDWLRAEEQLLAPK